jgi:hypothetical protein
MNGGSATRSFGFAIGMAITLVPLFLLFRLVVAVVIGAVLLIALVAFAASSGCGSGGLDEDQGRFANSRRRTS